MQGQTPQAPDDKPVPSSSRWLPVIVVCVSAVFVYLQVFVLPGTPTLATGDQAIYLHHATRLLNGEIIYRDYDHFTLPGTDVLYMVLFRLFGVRAWIPQAMLVVLGAALVWLILSISQKFLGGTAAYLPPLLFITLPFSGYLDATHHWYGIAAALAALAILLEERTVSRLAWAGVFVALATFFTQSMALVGVGFALFLLWERGRRRQTWIVLLEKECALLGGFLITLTACMAYFVWKVGLSAIFYYTVTFVAKYYPADWFNNPRVYLTGRPDLHVWTSWVDVPAFTAMHLVVPFIYVLFLVAYAPKWRALDERQRGRLALLYVTGVFLFLTVASAPAYSRLYVVSGPALVLVVVLLRDSTRMPRAILWCAWGGVFVMLMARPLVAQTRWTAYLDLPTGRTAFFNSLLSEKAEWISQRVHPGDYFFGDHQICFVLGLRNPARVPFLRPTDYTRPEEVSDAIEGIEKHRVRFVSWYIGLDRERRSMGYPEGNHLAPIRAYLQKHYHVAVTFANGDEIFERNP